jgi:integrase
MSNKAQVGWISTNVKNLYRHTNGRYYARISRHDKKMWKSLGTKLKSVAEKKLDEHISHVRGFQPSPIAVTEAEVKLTFGKLIERYQENFRRDPELADGTKAFREAGVKLVIKTWPGIADVNVRQITTPMVREWALRMRSEAKPYVPRNAKTPSRRSKGVSATTFNCALDAMRQVLDLGVEAGRIFSNPARHESIKRATPKLRRLVLPNRSQFCEIVTAIRNARCGKCEAAADMAEFLAYTGARQKESNHVTWSDVHFESGRITFRVTKNGEPRDVPLIPECRALLERMRAERPHEALDSSVLQVKNCNGFLRKATAEVKAPSISHHDLRHLFATTAIETGIDVPTVSRLMGHRDGGALAMKVYGHLRDEHAQQAMQRVHFGVLQPTS